MKNAVRKVVLISSNSLFREGLARVLEDLEGFELVGVAASIEAASEMLRRASPDVILLARNPYSVIQDESGVRLLQGSMSQVIELSVSDSDMTVYSRRRIPQATAADLAAALESME